MQIRREQMPVFAAAMQRQLEPRAMAHLRRAFPASAGKTPVEELPGQIRPAVEQARGYGITAGEDLLRKDLDPAGKLRGLDDGEAFSRSSPN
jgi:hypothetical protein